MTSPHMQSEPRHPDHSDYYLRITGILHDMSPQDVRHFTTAVGEHIKQYDGRPYEIELEEVG
jgi:hypothetical protein